jgi:hypothetical protein
VIRFVGPHPIDPTLQKGLCEIEGPHLHAYEPHKKVLYVKAGPAWAFVGDPTEFDREAPKVVYYGHHPAFWAEVDDTGLPSRAEVRYYCYISGPHHHLYPPPSDLAFKEKGSAYFFVGAHPTWYKARAHHDLDRHYATVEIVHPVVTVSPPEGYIEVSPWVGPHQVHVRGGGARVEVNIPFPTFGIVVGPGDPGPPPPGYVGPHHPRPRHGPPPHAPAWGKRGHRGHGRGR